jgi:hypothetical protein
LHDSCGDGQLYTTIEDLFLWDRNFYHNILGGYGQDLIEEITTPGKLDNGEVIAAAFGLQIGHHGGLKRIMHGGGWMGYRSQYIRFPDAHFSVVCLANLGTFNPTKLALQVADIYLEDEYTQEVAKQIPRSVTSIDLPLAELQLRTGFYHNPTTGSIWELEIKEEKLMAKLAWMYFQLAPIDSTHFQSIDGEFNYDVEFPDNSTQMIVKVDPGNGIKVYTLEKMISSTTDTLVDYVGNYYSAELEFNSEIYLEDNQLFIKYKYRSPFQLKSIGQDLFLLEADRCEFERDEQSRVIGFDRCSDRVRRIHYLRS